jgi:hypothetical protein
MAAGQILIPLPSAGSRIELRPSIGVKTGTITHTDIGGGVNRVVVPAGSAMTTGHTAPGWVIFPTGFTVVDVLDQYVGARLRDVTPPGGSGANLVLGIGLVYSAGTPDPTTDDYVWGKVAFGNGTDANTDVNVVTRKKANAITNGDDLADFDYADFVIRHHSKGTTRDTFVLHSLGDANHSVRTTTDQVAVALTKQVYVVVFCGLSGTEASPQTIDFKVDFIPKGAA